MADWNNGANAGGDFSEPAYDEHGGNDGFGGAAGEQTCRSCGQQGHYARECPDKPPMLCRACNQEGHFAKECPEKPAQVCKNCGQEGHIRQHCENARLISRDHIATITPEEAWTKIKLAVAKRDMDDVREAVQEYMKSMSGTPTYRDLQEGFIGDNIGLWFIPLERELLPVFSNMDLQGNMGKKWSVSYRFSEKPERPIEVDGWPASREAILARLDDAGEPTNTGKSRCARCGEVGHIAKECAQEPEERQAPQISCFNCSGVGHRVRDCPQPRIDRDACRNCGKSGHRANECDEPPNPENVECRRCNEKGHFAKDCPTAPSFACRNCNQEGHKASECDQPRNMDLVTCRNCKKQGHMSRDCPEPKDWSKVQCSRCNEYGHTKVRCTKPPVDDGGFDNDNFDSSAPGGMETGHKVAGGGDSGWQQDASYSAPAIDSGGW